MITEYITEGATDKYHLQLRATEIIATRNSPIKLLFGEVIEGKDVARIDLLIQNVDKIEMQIQGLKQGIALIHVYIHFMDSTIETVCIHHRGVNC
jgi:hypothetical protein